MSTGAGASALQVNFASLDCFAQCQALYDAYTQMLMGKRRIRVIYDNYQVEYAPNETAALLQLYNTLRAQCPQAAALPNLQPGNRVMRGPPIHGTMQR